MIKNTADALEIFIQLQHRWKFASLGKTNRMGLYVMNRTVWNFYELVMGWEEGIITNRHFGGPIITPEVIRQREWMREGRVLWLEWFPKVKKEFKKWMIQQKENLVAD